MTTPGKTYAACRAYLKDALLGEGQTEAEAEATLRHFDKAEAVTPGAAFTDEFVQRFYDGGNRRDN